MVCKTSKCGELCKVCNEPTLRFANKNKTVLDFCETCMLSRFPWEDGTEIIYEKPLRNSYYRAPVRVEMVVELPEVCPGRKNFAIGALSGQFSCLGQKECLKTGKCLALWAFTKGSCKCKDGEGLYFMSDIISGNAPVSFFAEMTFPFDGETL